MVLYAGIDLHSSNNFIGIINEEAKKIYSKRLANNLGLILNELKPFQNELRGIIVESTYNWYWLVDGLNENGYKVHLANPAAIKQYEGIKHTDDKWDSFWLADMRRLNILPEGYIYPKENRPVRDLLRRRLLFMKHRTANILSFQSMITRNLGIKISGREIKKMSEEDVFDLFKSSFLCKAAQNNIKAIRFLSPIIKEIEKDVIDKVKLKKEFEMLRTIPGIGEILAITIMLEVGNINRFAKVTNYSSYCRCVTSKRLSNGKKKGEGNRKNGNKYLSWAYIEAANFAKRFCTEAGAFYQRKKAKKNEIVAIKALSNKIARASYFIMRDQVPFDKSNLFK